MTSASLYPWSPEKCPLWPRSRGRGPGRPDREGLPASDTLELAWPVSSISPQVPGRGGGGAVPWGLHGVQDTFARYMKAKHEASSSEGSGS